MSLPCASNSAPQEILNQELSHILLQPIHVLRRSIKIMNNMPIGNCHCDRVDQHEINHLQPLATDHTNLRCLQEKGVEGIVVWTKQFPYKQIKSISAF